jgi:hypothetical protein
MADLERDHSRADEIANDVVVGDVPPRLSMLTRHDLEMLVAEIVAIASPKH